LIVVGILLFGVRFPIPAQNLKVMFKNIIRDYLTAIALLKEAIWADDRKTAEDFLEGCLNEAAQCHDFPVYLTHVEEGTIVYKNWFLAIERVREEVTRIYKSDNPQHLLDFIRENSVGILFYNKEENFVKDYGGDKYEVISQMADVWMKKEQDGHCEKRQFLFQVLSKNVISLD